MTSHRIRNATKCCAKSKQRQERNCGSSSSAEWKTRMELGNEVNRRRRRFCEMIFALNAKIKLNFLWFYISRACRGGETKKNDRKTVLVTRDESPQHSWACCSRGAYIERCKWILPTFLQFKRFKTEFNENELIIGIRAALLLLAGVASDVYKLEVRIEAKEASLVRLHSVRSQHA